MARFRVKENRMFVEGLGMEDDMSEWQPGQDGICEVCGAAKRWVARPFPQLSGLEPCPRHAAVDGLLAAVDLLMNHETGHFYDCLPGKRGSVPGPSCSRACVDLRAAIARAEARKP